MAGTMALQNNRHCVPFAAKAGGAAASDDLILSVSVGAGASVAGPDVLRVQKALNQIPASFGGPSPRLVEDSQAGKLTIAAIAAFQERHLGFKDGRVDVLGKTHAKISSLQPAKLLRMQTGKGYLSQAMNCMQAAQTGLAAAGVELLSGGGFLGTRNLDLADKHFDIRKSSDPQGALRQVAAIYTAMLFVFARPGGLWGWSAFEAEPFTNPNYYAYTWWGGFSLSGRYAGWQRLDTIYLSAYYDKSTNDNRIQTIVHELSHFVGPVSGDQIYDYAYGQQSDPQMKSLTPYQKQHNAESFGNYAFEAKFGRFPI
jgi:peptidoglycan hydrolase-like protein with peptidoglycan-binding domain